MVIFFFFSFWLLGSTTDFTPRCKFDHALAPRSTLFQQICVTLSRSLGSGGLGHPTTYCIFFRTREEGDLRMFLKFASS
ncbi:hypothetical protein EDB83DRAFT_2338571 [Lactarius deliciosus]|nr:hypothetical protein EDB83DRAFT_2338571 [Lactarius deliciosus]